MKSILVVLFISFTVPTLRAQDTATVPAPDLSFSVDTLIRIKKGNFTDVGITVTNNGNRTVSAFTGSFKVTWHKIEQGIDRPIPQPQGTFNVAYGDSARGDAPIPPDSTVYFIQRVPGYNTYTYKGLKHYLPRLHTEFVFTILRAVYSCGKTWEQR